LSIFVPYCKVAITKNNFHIRIFLLTKEHFYGCIICAVKAGGGWRKAFQRKKSKNLKRKLNPEKPTLLCGEERKRGGLLTNLSSTFYLSAG